MLALPSDGVETVPSVTILPPCGGEPSRPQIFECVIVFRMILATLAVRRLVLGLLLLPALRPSSEAFREREPIAAR